MIYIDVDHGSLSLLRFPEDNGSGVKLDNFVDEKTKEKDSDGEKYILCRHCGNIITSPSERIEKDGSHMHTFANPHGVVFEIGCFRFARGCGHFGQFTDQFSWFKGFDWKVSVCGRCLTHLGWLFKAHGNEVFHGLILDKLTFNEEYI